MDQISQHINYTNHYIHSYDQISKRVVNLGSNKGDNNDRCDPQFSCLYSSLLMRPVETYEYDFPYV